MLEFDGRCFFRFCMAGFSANDTVFLRRLRLTEFKLIALSNTFATFAFKYNS